MNFASSDMRSGVHGGSHVSSTSTSSTPGIWRTTRPMIMEDIDRVVHARDLADDVDVELTWDPPWTPDRMSDDAKFILGFG